MNPKVIHHYQPAHFPSVTKADVPKNSRVLSAAWRQAGQAPALYVEKPNYQTLERASTLETFFVGTGHDFDLPSDFDFVGTCMTPDGIFFWHVYARITS